MGYYIHTPMNHDKARYLVRQHGGEIISAPVKFADIPDGKMLVCVVDNGAFEAAGLAYSSGEFEAFTEKEDPRPRTFVLLDITVACELSGFTGPY